MSTLTLGTNATTSLTSLKWSASMNAADFATLQQAIKYDSGPQVGVTFPGALVKGNAGQLFIPGRGVLSVMPGDYIGVDSTTGWPILVSAKAIASGPWTHS